ncbi:hypothetical protein [Streptomyces sp. NBC_00083]|uniref:hypothetical protein n=1 Tax=Streptomyces sp. NBC_00083 TaxID=2975647 RepID=UPI00225BAD05|nr:hypothetical protein [Streptomyces sp. NBC_00083]MCX5387268.1 hypothetical protein [Streptomyces sp. NBC_00083]
MRGARAGPGARRAGAAPAADRTRLQGAYLHVPVVEAFDAMLNVPFSTVVPGPMHPPAAPESAHSQAADP